jgi:hypothetical protein
MRIVFNILGIVLLCALPPLARGDLSSVSCPANTLAYYQLNFSSSTRGSANGPCANGILDFSGFSFSSFGNTAVGSNQIDLTPLGPPLGQTGPTGFSISGLSVGIGQTVEYVIDWYFAIDSGPIASGGDLGMDPPFGDVVVTQDYCVDSYFSGSITEPSCSNGKIFPPLQSLTVTTSVPTASLIFDPPAFEFGDVRTIIDLNGGTTGAGFDSLTGDARIITPEPGMVPLAVIGMSILFCLRKRAVRQ